MARDVSLREATLDDALALAQLHVRTGQVAYEGVVAKEILDQLSVEKRMKAWQDVIGKPESPLIVSCREGEITGFVSYGQARDDDVPGDGELYAIYVDPDDWGTGTGALLMKECSDWLEGRFPAAVLWVLRDNERACRFYERWGWQPDGKSQVLERLGDVVEVRYRVEF